MRLTGIIDYSMGNFLCIRGFAPMIDLSEISFADTNIQRDLIEEHRGEMEAFLSSGEFTFFPEVILCANMRGDETDDSKIDSIREHVRIGNNYKKTSINQIKFSTKIYSIKQENNDMAYDKTQTVLLEFDKTQIHKFLRIDGNHRLSAVTAGSTYASKPIPYCLLLFRTSEETDKFCRALFYNINTKQIPLKTEQNLKVIIDSELVFSDDTLKADPSFGWNYYLAREAIKQIDIAYFPAVNSYISSSKYTYFVELFKYLMDNGVVDKDIAAVAEIRAQLNGINTAIQESEIISTTDNIAVLGALSYYKLTNKDKYHHFIRWITKNDIGSIETLRLENVINIYDKIYVNAPKKVFLARWYPEYTSPEHENAVHRLVTIKEVVESLGLELVDMGTRTTGAFDIRTVMYDELSKCDIFIADLTGSRHNVMVEVGYALKHVDTGRMVFYFQPKDDGDRVPFDLNGFAYDQINDSRELKTKTKLRLQTILNKAKAGEL